MTTDAAQFQKLLGLIPAEIMPKVWFIPLVKGSKDPDVPEGAKLKDEKHRLTPDQALDRIKKGLNVGIYAIPKGLLFLDVDTKNGNIVLPELIINTLHRTLTIKTRNGGLQYYFINNGSFKNKIHTYDGIKAGEIRADWYYVVAPGSYVKPDEGAAPDATGLYTIVDDAPMVEFTKIPKGITIKEDKPKKEIEIKTQHTWKNDLGMPLYEIRRKSQKLDTLLNGANEGDRSAADMAAAQLLYFWRFSDPEIAGILREYRPYEKTARQDYLETTISKIDRVKRYDPNYHKNNNTQAEGGNTCGNCVFKPRGGAGSCRNPENEQNKTRRQTVYDAPACDKFKEKQPNNETKKAEIQEPEPENTQKHIIEKANQILNEGKAIEFLVSTCGKFHIGDVTTIKATFGAIGNQSITNSSGIQPKVSGGSGKGKSHAEKTVFHLVPKEYVLETSLTAKALFHANVKPGTIIFSDDADIGDDLEGVIKRSTTNYQEKTNHTLSIKNGSEWTVKTVTIPERIIWALTSVADNGSIEYINRQFNLGVDETVDQDARVWEHIRGMAKEGEKEFAVTDDVLTCREIIRDIKKHLFRVKIPYADRIRWNNTDNRRMGAQFLDFIKAFTVFNYPKRAKTGDILEANEDDFKNAVELYGQRAPNQRLKLNDNEIALLKLMVKDEQYTLEKLQEISGKSYQSVRRMLHGRDNNKSGLLEKVPGLIYRQETDFLGEAEIRGEGEYEKEYITVKKTKPKHIYVLTVDFTNLLNFGTLADLEPEVKT